MMVEGGWWWWWWEGGGPIRGLFLGVVGVGVVGVVGSKIDTS